MIIPQKLYGIIGYPLGHSQSPLFHNWAFQQAQLPAAYLAWPTSSLKLPDFIKAVRTLPITGLSVTIPHKEAVLPLLDQVTEAARQVGAVNTLFWKNGELWGDNTDILGFTAPLQGKSFDKALVLGAGGAARSVLTGLKILGVAHIVVSNHNDSRAEALAHEFEVDSVPWEKRTSVHADILINTTPLGLKGLRVGESPYPAEAFAASFAADSGRTSLNPRLAYDLVYNPLRTCFLQSASAVGWDTQDGLDMFVAQAQEQFRLWTGKTPDAAQARQMLLEATKGVRMNQF